MEESYEHFAVTSSGASLPDMCKVHCVNGGWEMPSIVVRLKPQFTEADLQLQVAKVSEMVTEDGRVLRLRFWEPRVLKIFLQSCTPTQLTDFFWPIEVFYASDETGSQFEYRLADGQLLVRQCS